ncbi:SDR family NAD(P)-dependent oxidoreductase [Paraflavitalea pollutisoli]|uniref:SDR family NAD(P)-dependent oxidoreductase n=1 Tax=Paraflavitalea pollutisoli TaxID=3034143 RepID=UPI0023EC9D56|nr:SDR family oxidoreductase [Paraflavitalea sp. H1-2-19X]
MAFTIDLSGKTALVTGASSGIGLGIALQLAKAGARIAACGMDPEAPALLQGVEALGGQVLYLQADVTREDELYRLVQHAVAVFDGIDILVSNAGRNVFTGATSSTAADWQGNMDLNLTSHWQLAQKCRPWLEKSNGVIILMSSNQAFSTIPGCFPYNVAKTALTGLVSSLAIEWGPAIRTVGMAPGFIDTPGNQRWFDGFADPQAERQKTIDRHPVRRLGTTEEIGGWCVFLASGYAAFASGTTYLIDGGRSALLQDA